MAKDDKKCDTPLEIFNIGPIRQNLPIMIWDGECAFCSRWIKRWHKITGEKVQYAPYQTFNVNRDSRLQTFPSLSIKDCKRTVQLVMPDGSLYHGAEAVFRALDASGNNRVWLWLYTHLPGFKFLSESFYNIMASHRPLFSKLSR